MTHTHNMRHTAQLVRCTTRAAQQHSAREAYSTMAHTHTCITQWPQGEQDVVPPAPGAVQIGVSVEPAAEIVHKEGSKLAARWVWKAGGERDL